MNGSPQQRNNKGVIRMKNIFEAPELEILKFNQEDIITTSGRQDDAEDEYWQ